jgi:hypothetical protein
MEKDNDSRPNQLVREFSYDYVVQQAPIEAHENEDVDIEHDAASVAKHPGVGMQLTRTVSTGPPYSIFSHRAKMFIILSVSVSSLISPFGATTFYPALNVLARELNVTPTLVNLALTTYMVLPFNFQDIHTLANVYQDRSSPSTGRHRWNV